MARRNLKCIWLARGLSLMCLLQVNKEKSLRLLRDFIMLLTHNMCVYLYYLEFYVGDGGYGAFAAKDCSVNLARMSFDEKDYN